MATSQRSITTKVAVEGDKAYQNSLKNINAVLKTLQSQLTLTQQSFQSNQNSEEALTKTSQALTNVYQTHVQKYNLLKQALDNARSAQDAFAQRMTAASNGLQSTTARMSELEARTKSNREAYNRYAEQLAAAKEKQAALQKSTEDTNAAQIANGLVIQGLEKRMAALDEEMKTDGQEMEYLRAKNAELNTSLNNATSGYDTATRTAEKYETQLNEEQITINELNERLTKLEQYLKEAQSSTDKCATSIDNFGKEVKESSEEMDELGDKSEELNQSMTDLGSLMSTIGLTKMLEKVKEAFEACIEVASQFEYTMATVEAVSGATDEQLSELSQQAQEWAGSTIFLAEDIADTYAQMGRAGWDAQDMLDSMSGVMSLAAASGEDLSSVTTIVTSTLTAFGSSASDAAHFADVLSETAADSNTNVAQLGEAFTAVGTTAGTLGYSIDDVSQALGIMANNGLRGQMSGTALSTALTRMSGANANATKAMESLGISMYDSEGNARSLSDFLGDLRSSFDGLSQAEQENLAYNLAGQRGMKGLLAIVNSSEEDWNNMATAIQNCSGAAEEMSDIQLDTYTGSVQLLQSAIEGLEMEVGNQLEPALRNIVDSFTSIVTGIKEWCSENEAAVPIITGVVTALGLFTTGVTVATTAVAAFNAVQKVMNPGLEAFITVLGGVAAISGVVIADIAASANAADDETNSIASLNAQIAETKKAAEELATAHAEYAASSAATAAENDTLISSLQGLVSAYDGSASSAAEINSIIDQLNSNVPGLSLSFDEQTGTLNMTADAIDNLADSYQAYNDLMDAIEDRNEKEQTRLELINELTAAQERLTEAQKYEAMGEEQNSEIVKESGHNWQYWHEEVEDATAAVEEQKQAVSTATIEYNNAQLKVNDLKNSYDDLNPVVEETTEVTDEAAAAKERLAAREEEAAEAAAEEAEKRQEAAETLREINQDIKNASGSTAELREKYEELCDEYEALDGEGGEYQRNLTEQRLAQMNLMITTQELTEAFGRNLDEMGINSQSLAQMLIDSGISVEDFASDVQANLTDLINGWEEYDLSETKSLQDINDALKANTADYAAFNDASQNAWNMAVATGDENVMAYVQNLIDQGVEGTDALKQLVNDGEGALLEAGSRWGAAEQEAMEAALLQFSEEQKISYDEAWQRVQDGEALYDEATKTYQNVGEGATDGATTGAEESSDAFTEAITGMLDNANASALEYSTTFTATGETLTAAIATGISNGTGTLTRKLKSALNSARNSASDIRWDNLGKSIVEGIASGITQNTSTLNTAIRSMIQESLAAGRDEADVNSPSKLFRDKLGAAIAEGTAVGISKNLDSVREASQALVYAAMPPELDDVTSKTAETAQAISRQEADRKAAGAENDSEKQKDEQQTIRMELATSAGRILATGTTLVRDVTGIQNSRASFAARGLAGM